MYRQLTLWPETEIFEPQTEIWEKVDPNTKKTLVTTLARIIYKAIRSETLVDDQEVNHEHE